MQCQLCHAEEAVVHLKQIVNGEVTELHVCETCASESGVDLHSQLDMGQLAGILAKMESREDDHGIPDQQQCCRECHMTLDEYRRTRRLGCPACYEAFREPLSEVLLEIQKRRRHVGKRLPGADRRAERRRLLLRLDEAIAEQRFEEAAVLRDLLRDLEQEGVRESTATPGDR